MKKNISAILVCMSAFIWHSQSFELQTKIAIAQELPPNNSVLDQKQIVVTLENQTLTYFEGTRVVGEFKISSGLIKTPTPTSEFEVISKKPIVNYIGPGYNYPKTKWNLMFKESPGGNYYIHGAYWHNNFGKPMSGGCVNVSYANMEGLYDWADVGTKIIIQEKAKRHPRGTVVLSDGTVYFLGDKIRYPFPSPDVFYSWGLKFDDVLNANDLDMVMPLGPIVEFKTLAIR